MSNFLKTFAPFIIALLFGALTITFAQNGKTKTNQMPDGDRPERRMPPPEGRGGGLHPGTLERLDLTDEQKQQIEAIHAASREASKANFDKMRGFDEQLRKAIEGGNFDEAQTRQILTEKAQVQIELEISRLRADAAVLKILTAEQKAQLEQLKQERREPPMRGGFRPDAPPVN